MANTLQNWEQMTYPFESVNLNYSFNALEPFIDTKTMQVHYNNLYSNYVNNLNQFLETHSELQNMTLSELLIYAENYHDDKLRQTAGAVYNHCFYLTELRPATGQIVIGITPQATQKITTYFGGWKMFKEQFSQKALEYLGSGYVWLVKDNQGRLKIITTDNENSPLNCQPVLCLDVWEHAYYLRHSSNRKAYLDAFWQIIDWVKLSAKI